MNTFSIVLYCNLLYACISSHEVGKSYVLIGYQVHGGDSPSIFIRRDTHIMFSTAAIKVTEHLRARGHLLLHPPSTLQDIQSHTTRGLVSLEGRSVEVSSHSELKVNFSANIDK